jgi:RNA polymerase sigma-70 factor (ECF subfamily)
VSPALTRDDAAEQVFWRARTGERAALETLIRSEWPRIHRIISAEMGDRMEAEDLTQEAFARVLPRLASFESIGSLRAYLSQVARNLVRDRWRRRRFVDPHTEVADHPIEGPGPEALALAGIEGEMLHSALERLPEDYRTVLRLRLSDGLSSAETAARMRRSDAAVRQLQHRALVQLREEYTAVVVGAGGSDVVDA